MLFDQNELETWLKQGRIGGHAELAQAMSSTIDSHEALEAGMGVVDISSGPVYHRNGRYR
jgi:hypothetical protein